MTTPEPLVRVNVAELSSLIGQVIGPTTAIRVSQERIDAFAEATLDHQWIHVDPTRAAETDFGGTIAHGFLTLSLLSVVMYEALVVEDADMAINYGLNRVRFPSPLSSGSDVRATVTVQQVNPGVGSTDMVADVVFTAIGATKPCCVAQSVTRFVHGHR